MKNGWLREREREGEGEKGRCVERNPMTLSFRIEGHVRVPSESGVLSRFEKWHPVIGETHRETRTEKHFSGRLFNLISNDVSETRVSVYRSAPRSKS